jgi:uncharacterized protein
MTEHDQDLAPLEAATEDGAPEVIASESLLTFEESRVLGCMLEKEVTTPDYYPMTLNSVTTACNQRSNRSPIVEWDDKVVDAALTSLRRKRLAVMKNVSGARVPKYYHTLGEVLDQLTAAGRAILCELMIRGRQTLGELRTNTDRMYSFPDLPRLEEAVQSLVDYPTGPLVVVLPPGLGRKVKTVAHLLCGPVAADAPLTVPSPTSTIIPPPPDWQEEMAALRARVAVLEAFMNDLKG